MEWLITAIIEEVARLGIGRLMGYFTTGGVLAGVSVWLFLGRRMRRLEHEMHELRKRIDRPESTTPAASTPDRTEIDNPPVVGKLISRSDSKVTPIVPTSPERLVRSIKGMTKLAAGEAVRPYIGAPMTISGSLQEMSKNLGMAHRDQISVMVKTESKIYCHFEFDHEQWKDFLLPLKVSTEISASGFLRSVSELGLSLENCKLHAIGDHDNQ